MREIDVLRHQLLTIRRIAASAQLERTAPAVSAWGTSQHIDHCLKVTTGMLRRVVRPKPEKGRINIVGRLVLLVGWIPRGRGKAPERVLGAQASREEVDRMLDDLEQVVATITPEAFTDRRTAVIRHPYFGGLTAEQALRFTVIHNRHHLKIIDDIAR